MPVACLTLVAAEKTRTKSISELSFGPSHAEADFKVLEAWRGELAALFPADGSTPELIHNAARNVVWDWGKLSRTLIFDSANASRGYSRA